MKTRIRTHSFPGDISRDEKIARWERKDHYFGGLVLSPRALQNRRKCILARERAILKEQTRREIEES